MTKNEIRAKAPVTVMLAVGEPRNGNMPMRLQKRMKTKSVHKKGTNISAWGPMLGLATLSRMNCRMPSKAFQKPPRGGSPLLARRASGMKMISISTAAMSVRTMKRVSRHGRKNSHPLDSNKTQWAGTSTCSNGLMAAHSIVRRLQIRGAVRGLLGANYQTNFHEQREHIKNKDPYPEHFGKMIGQTEVEGEPDAEHERHAQTGAAQDLE